MSASPVTVELQVTRHLAVRDGVRRLLQAESLEVDANAAIRDDEVRIDGTLHSGGILTEEREDVMMMRGGRERHSRVTFPVVVLTCCTCAAERSPAGPAAEGCC